jgi:dTDP-4-dehydrorhamnose reductase
LNSLLNSKTLIVGVNSQLGACLAEFLQKNEFEVQGTTRRSAQVSENTLYFDLLDSDCASIPGAFDYVVICAGITNITACEENREKCELVNVDNTIKLIEHFRTRGSFVVFPSSNAVFDGSTPFNNADEPPNPISNYGKFKRAVEDYIALNSAENAAVIRLTKIINKRSPFLRDWLSSAAKGLEINAFNDKIFSPLPIEDAVEGIVDLMKTRRPGLFQLGGSKEVTYYDYAKALFANDPKKLELVRPIHQLESKPYFNHHNSLTKRMPE